MNEKILTPRISRTGGGAVNMKLLFSLFLLLFSSSLFALDSFQIANEGDKISVGGQKIEVSTVSVFQLITSNTINMANGSILYIGSGTVDGGGMGLHLTKASGGDWMIFEDKSAAANSRKWLIKGNGGNMEFLIADDAWTSWTQAIFLKRTGTTFNELSVGGYIGLLNVTAANLKTFTPTSTGDIIYNSTDLDLYVATGTAAGAWRNVRTGGAP